MVSNTFNTCFLINILCWENVCGWIGRREKSCGKNCMRPWMWDQGEPQEPKVQNKALILWDESKNTGRLVSLSLEHLSWLQGKIPCISFKLKSKCAAWSSGTQGRPGHTALRGRCDSISLPLPTPSWLKHLQSFLKVSDLKEYHVASSYITNNHSLNLFSKSRIFVKVNLL